MVAVVVTYPPSGKSLAYHHARSAFIYVYVLSGTIRSQIDGGRWCAHSCQRLSYIIRKLIVLAHHSLHEPRVVGVEQFEIAL